MFPWFDNHEFRFNFGDINKRQCEYEDIDKNRRQQAEAIGFPPAVHAQIITPMDGNVRLENSIRGQSPEDRVTVPVSRCLFHAGKGARGPRRCSLVARYSDAGK